MSLPRSELSRVARWTLFARHKGRMAVISGSKMCTGRVNRVGLSRLPTMAVGANAAANSPPKVGLIEFAANPTPAEAFAHLAGHAGAGEWINNEIASAGEESNEVLRKLRWESCRMYGQSLLPAVLLVSGVRFGVGYGKEVRRDRASIVFLELR